MNTPDDQPNRRILVIDDDRSIHNSFRAILRGADPGKSALDEAEAPLFGEATSGRRAVGFTMESAYQGGEGIELVRGALDKGQPFAIGICRHADAARDGRDRNDHKTLRGRRQPPGCDLHGVLGLRLA